MLSLFRHLSLVSHDFSISCYSIYSSGSKLETREKRLSLSHPESTKRRSQITTDRETSCESSPPLLPLSLWSIAESPRIAPGTRRCQFLLLFFAFISHKGRKEGSSNWIFVSLCFTHLVHALLRLMAQLCQTHGIN